MNRTTRNAAQKVVPERRRVDAGSQPNIPIRHRSRRIGRGEGTSMGGALGDQRVAWRSPDKLRPQARNPRTHSDKQITQIKASIEEFGFVNAVLIDGAGRIIAGHGRVEAAKRLGLEQVPTLRIDHLSEDQLRAYVIADNRLAEIAGWDKEILATEFQHLSKIDVDVDPEATAFETAEIDLTIEEQEATKPDPADEVQEIVESGPAVSRKGDLWRLGRHRLLCADAQDSASYDRLMAGESVRMVFIDPPYNVPIDGHVSGLGRTKHREFVMGSGEMSPRAFQSFLQSVLCNHAAACVDGALLYVCMDWRHLLELLQAGRASELVLMNICVWNKSNGGMGSFYRSKHELVPVFKKGRAPHKNNVELGRHGRYRTNVWDYAGINTFGANRLDELAMHPTVKPTALVADAIKDCTRRGDIVLDGFAGSGTTLIAAERSERIGCGLELDPRYVDVAVRRWERLTGRKAVHAETGLTIEELAQARGLAEYSRPDAGSQPKARKGGKADDDR